MMCGLVYLVLSPFLKPKSERMAAEKQMNIFSKETIVTLFLLGVILSISIWPLLWLESVFGEKK